MMKCFSKDKVMKVFEKYGYIKYIAAIAAALLFSDLPISYSTYSSGAAQQKIVFFKPVINKLIEMGADSAFVYNCVSDSKTKFDEKFVKINVSGFINKTDYSHFYNSTSIKQNRDFISENLELLTQAESKFGVPKEVISSIMWIETRHGSYLGKNHILSVFFSTALCNQKDFIALNKKSLRENPNVNPDDIPQLEEKIVKRANKKANWALKEILALEKMEKQSPISVSEIYGSWAGAFGMSQFLPSSYMSWAVDGDIDGKINLFSKADAIFSIANYLKINGWSNSAADQKKAVYHYNNSNDYVNAVLTLAEKSKYTKLNKTLQQQMDDLDKLGE